MKVFVTGASGQLGHDVCLELNRRGIENIGISSKDVDICDETAIKNALRAFAPDAVIHCAAYSAVDRAEDEPEKCREINVNGTTNIAKACQEIGAKMLYISTDYVFNGMGTQPWDADCKDYAPLSVYGQSKLDGELAVAENLNRFFIVRTAWVFGMNGKNFVKTMLNVGKTHDAVRVVNDQIGTPTYTPDLAVLLCDMIATDKYGYYHATNEGGYISWYDFTCEIYRQAGYSTKVIPVTTEEYGLSRAKRPENSRLDKSKLDAAGFHRLPDWRDALYRYLRDLQHAGLC